MVDFLTTRWRRRQMRRNVAVVGAGQGGLILALGLIQRGHDVTLFAERPATAVLTGPATGSSVLMGRSILIERELGLNRWDDLREPVDNVHLTLYLGDPGQPEGDPQPVPTLDIVGRFDPPGAAIDQRLKFATWQGL